MIVANYTPDPITYTHGGLSATLKSGEIVDIEEKKANFILNKFDKRGLVAMKFGDDPDTKRQEAMALWTRFWRRQIIVYNQDNERRRNTQREYVEPSQELVEHATKLGIELLGPWTIKQADNAAVQAVLIENANLKVEMSALKSQMQDLIDAMKARQVPIELQSPAEKIETTKREARVEAKAEDEPKPAPAVLADHKPLIAEFQMLTADKFGQWVMTNLDRIQANDFPLEVRQMIEQKWERLIKGEFPIPLS